MVINVLVVDSTPRGIGSQKWEEAFAEFEEFSSSPYCLLSRRMFSYRCRGPYTAMRTLFQTNIIDLDFHVKRLCLPCTLLFFVFQSQTSQLIRLDSFLLKVRKLTLIHIQRLYFGPPHFGFLPQLFSVILVFLT
jgi:hypothetical protein